MLRPRIGGDKELLTAGCREKAREKRQEREVQREVAPIARIRLRHWKNRRDYIRFFASGNIVLRGI